MEGAATATLVHSNVHFDVDLNNLKVKPIRPEGGRHSTANPYTIRQRSERCSGTNKFYSVVVRLPAGDTSIVKSGDCEGKLQGHFIIRMRAYMVIMI